MIVRWVGAFRSRLSEGLESSLKFEITQRERKVVAAERLKNGRSEIRARVGLLVKNRSIVRKFSGDVYSEYRSNGKLRKNRKEGMAMSSHTEVWCKSDFCGIVVKRGVSELSMEIVQKVGREFNLPILRLTKDGRLVPM